MCDCILLACCGACAAAIFLIVIYFFFGIIFISLAVRAKTAVEYYGMLTNTDLSLFPNLCIVIGTLFTLVTLLGLAGEKTGKKTRIVYGIAQITLVILGVVIYVWADPNDDRVEKSLFQGLQHSINKYGQTDVTTGTNYTNEWDQLQESLECCGVLNYLDWEKVKIEGPHPPTPISCCRADHRMTGCSTAVKFDHPFESNKLIYVQGCFENIRMDILGKLGILNWFLIPILFVTTFGCLVSCCSSGVKTDDANVEEKKVGPIIVRANTKKLKIKAAGEKDIEKGMGGGTEKNGQGKTGETVVGAGDDGNDPKNKSEVIDIDA